MNDQTKNPQNNSPDTPTEEQLNNENPSLPDPVKEEKKLSDKNLSLPDPTKELETKGL